MSPFKFIGGYTLVELFVSLTVLLCLFSLLMPSLSAVKTKQAVTLKTWEIKRTLEYARSLAVTQNKTVSVCTAMDNYRCVKRYGSRLLIFNDRDKNSQWTKDESLYRDAILGNARVRLSASWGSSVVRFKNSGESIESGNFLVCMPSPENFGRQVIFYHSGRVRLSKDSDKDGYDDRSRLPILCNELV